MKINYDNCKSIQHRVSIASSPSLAELLWSWFNSINCKSDKTKLLDLLIKACWEIQLEPGASSNDRKKKKNEAWRDGYHHLMKYFTHILFDAVFVPEGQMMESVTLCDCKEGGGSIV